VAPRPVLFVTSEFPPSGAGIGVFVRSLAGALSSRGRECWVATWGRIPELDPVRRIIRIPFIPVPPLGDKLFARALRKLLKNSAIEDSVVNVHSPYPQSATVSEIATFHIVVKNLLSHGQFAGLKRAQYKLGFRSLCRNEQRLLGSKIVCAVSKAVAKDLAAEYGFDEDVRIVGNAVDSSFFKPGTKSKEPRVLYAGRLDLNKGVLDFVRLARLVRMRFPTAKFRMVGRGSARSLIVREIRRLGLKQSFNLPGYVPLDALLEEYQKAWVYVSPTRFEGFATSILEAMACCTLPVVSEIPSNKEMLSRQEGLFASSRTIEEYADLVTWALSNGDQADQMARKARERAIHDYSWEKVAQRYEAMLNGLDRP